RRPVGGAAAARARGGASPAAGGARAATGLAAVGAGRAPRPLLERAMEGARVRVAEQERRLHQRDPLAEVALRLLAADPLQELAEGGGFRAELPVPRARGQAQAPSHLPG